MPHLAISLLGAFEATLDGKPVTGFKTDKARLMLAYLAVESDRPHRRQSLVGLLWPGYPEKYARNNLRVALTNLRQVLKDTESQVPFILVEGETLQFNPDSDIFLDITAIAKVVSDNQSKDSIADLQTALSYYKGGFLEGFSLEDSPEFDNWTYVLRERYQGIASAILGRLAEAFEQRRDFKKAAFYARRRLELEPWQEAAHRQLMRLFALQGLRSEALAQYEACRKALREELNVEPSTETIRLYESIRDDRLPEPGFTQAHPNNLPAQLTHFIGRKQECNQLKGLLSTNRLVTLIGPGGVGKTRVAIKVAEDLLAKYKHGIWYVELAPIADPDLVPQTIAVALGLHVDQGIPITDLLLKFLHTKDILVLLDNCEHLVETCAFLVNQLVQACPNLKFFVTSREALGISGEVIYRLPSLTLPNLQDQQSKKSVIHYEAVELFLDRARGIMPGFEITDDNANIIAQICTRLDGIPLALELAAAQVNMLTAEQIFQRLNHAFSLLTGGARSALPHQQTLQATIDWSYQLLQERERRLLLRLSVFVDGCTLEGAESICGGNGLDEEEIFAWLASLVNKSIVNLDRSQGQEARYRLLETVRQYTREKFHDTGESALLRDRHLDYFVNYAETGYRMLMTEKRLEWTKWLIEELDNLRAAIDWAYTGGENLESGLRIAAALGFRFMPSQGYAEEATRWIRTGLAASDPTKIPDLLRVRALIALDWSLSAHNIYSEEGSALLKEAVQLCRKIGTQANPEQVYALGYLSFYKDRQEAETLWKEALEIACDLDRENIWMHANLLATIAYIEQSNNNFGAACQNAETALRLFGPKGCTDRWSSASTYNTLAFCEFELGKKSEAFAHWKKAIVLSQESGDKILFAGISCGQAMVLIRQGEFERAAYYNDQALRAWYLVGREKFVSVHIAFLGIILANIGSRLGDKKRVSYFTQAVTLLSIADAQCPPDDEKIYFNYQFTNRSETEQILQSHLNSDDYATAWTEGQSITFEEGVDLAAKIAEEWNF